MTYDTAHTASEILVNIFNIIGTTNGTDIYIEISDYIKEVQILNNLSEHDAHKLVTTQACNILEKLNTHTHMLADRLSISKDDSDALSINAEMYLKLLLYPIVNGYKIVDKTQEDFNINLKFFYDLMIDFSTNYIKNEKSKLIYIKEFKFDNQRLIEFTLMNLDYNILYYYDEFYNQSYIEFLDGEKLKLDIGK